MSEEKNIIDTRKQMKYVETIVLPDGTEADVYEVSENVYRYVFKDKKENGGLKLIPD